MKVLLVVGLAAVIIVILIAVFLSIRLGRGDDREDQPIRSGERGRSRGDTGDPRWRDRDSRDSRRPLPVSARSARSPGQRVRAEADQAGRYRDRDDRRADRDQGARSREYDRPQRRPERYDTSPGAASVSSRPVAAAAPRAGSGRDSASRRPSAPGRDRYDSEQALYDTGPTSRPSADDFPSGPFPAADYPSDVFPSGPMPVADFPSGPLPVADFPSGEYPAADYPSGGFPSGPLPVADFPSGDLPVTRSRSRSAPSKADTDAGRPDSRRKQPKSQNPPKGRSRPQRGKRDDDNEWPAMEWDKLSDEQYWAELSSDKPLSSSQPAADPKPAPAKNGQSRSGAAKAKPAASQPAPAPSANPAAGRDQAGRQAPGPQREAATERLPVRARQQASAAASHAAGLGAGGGRRGHTPVPPAQEPTIAMLASLGGTPAARPPDRLDDDPLTSPSFAIPAVDSRSYSSARKSVRPGDTGPHSAVSGPHPTGGYGYGGMDTPSHALYSAPPPSFPDAGYSYQPSPRVADWPGEPNQHTPAHGTAVHSTPAHGTPVQGNPYGSYVDAAPDAYPPAPQPGYADTYSAGGGYQSYASHAEPAGYPEPAYEPDAGAPYQGFPAAAAPVSPADAGHYPLQHAGYLGDGGYNAEEIGPAGYQDAYGHPGYAPVYPADYTGDPYGQEGYGGYSAAQG
jgi:hypothetical protein